MRIPDLDERQRRILALALWLAVVQSKKYGLTLDESIEALRRVWPIAKPNGAIDLPS